MISLPDDCIDENCCVNNPDMFPVLCPTCTILMVEGLKELPGEKKSEIFFAFKAALSDGKFDEFIDECCEEGNISREEYREIEDEIWNEILMEDR